MLKKLIVSALVAGFGAGVIIAALQIALISPLIIEAEEYESGALTHFAGAAEEDAHGGHEDGHAHAHSHDSDESWLARSARTLLSTTLASLGFAFVMVAGIGAAAHSGIETTARSGILWGLAGFVAVMLAPAMDLPPELPGSIAAPLEDRQIWWIGTAIASTAGLAAIAFGKNWAHWGAGIVLLAMPHVIGAPVTDVYGGVVPPEIQGEFVGLSIGVSAIGWAILGLLGGYAWAKQEA